MALLPWASKPLALFEDHAAGKAEGEGADFAGPPALARLVAVGQRVDVGVGLAEDLVEGGGHHGAGGVPRLQRRLGGELALLQIVVLQEEVAVVLVDEAEERPLEDGGIGAGAAAVGGIGHVPVGAFEPTGVVGPEVALGRAEAGADIAFGPHHLHHVVGLAAQTDHGKVVEQRWRDHHLDLVLAGLLAAAEPAAAGVVVAHVVILDSLLRQRQLVGRVAPVRLRREPPRRGDVDDFAGLVPGVEVVAVEQLEGEHLRRLRDLAGQLDQQCPGAAVAEVDHQVDVLGVAGGGRGGADAQLDGRDPLERPLLDVQQPFQANHEILGERVGLAEIADLGIAAGGVHGQEQPRGARLDDLPLDVGIDLGRLVFLARRALAALPAVADLAGLILAAAERNADELDPRVRE